VFVVMGWFLLAGALLAAVAGAVLWLANPAVANLYPFAVMLGLAFQGILTLALGELIPLLIRIELNTRR